MEKIIKYLNQTYQPLGIIVYGSFADGSNNLNSDFDALLIVENGERSHDNTFINGTELDVFIYPKKDFLGEISCEQYIQIGTGKVVSDFDGTATKLMELVRKYIENFTPKSIEENRTNVEWCEKMLQRAKRNDTEGFFRWHWLLIDSLEIYYDLCGKRYMGPKKSIRNMQEIDPIGVKIYKDALSKLEYEALEKWVFYLREKFDNKI